MRKEVKIIVKKHSDGYVAYARGLNGVVVGQGETYGDALADVRSAIAFHKQEFDPFDHARSFAVEGVNAQNHM